MRLKAFLFLAMGWPVMAAAQMPIPEAAPPDGAKLFRNQCATCHSINAGDAARQGPNLAHVVGRKVGSVDGYKYTAGYREAGESGQVWDEERLDKYLTNPAEMFPGSTMAYRQSKADIRKTIIAYLKEQG